MRRASEAAAMPAGAWADAVLGRGGGPSERVDVPASARAETGTGDVSHARRLIFSKWRGEMLSDVMLPPQPPHPSVIEGSSEVVYPMDPRVVGVFTTILKAGFFSPNCRMTS